MAEGEVFLGNGYGIRELKKQANMYVGLKIDDASVLWKFDPHLQLEVYYTSEAYFSTDSLNGGQGFEGSFWK